MSLAMESLLTIVGNELHYLTGNEYIMKVLCNRSKKSTLFCSLGTLFHTLVQF
jgi:hypothetical protein